MKRNNAGSSLVEIVAATAIMGILVGAVCTSLMFGLRLNEKTDAQLKAQLAVSTAVETLMAEGINPETDYSSSEVSVTVAEQKEGETLLPYYKVTVTSKTEEVSVDTYIRKAVSES